MNVQMKENLKRQAEARAKWKTLMTTTPVETPLLVTTDTETVSAAGKNLPQKHRKTRWQWGVLAAFAMALLSLYPQFDLWLVRGADWQGAYASHFYDEEYYVDYINGLLLGRPRMAEPFGIPEPGKPPHESLFSIQAVPAYLVVSFARLFGLTASQAVIVLIPLLAFLATFMLFYLIFAVIRNEALAATGAFAVLVFGALAARHSVILNWMGWNKWPDYFLFLRFYEPAAVFPIFFGFVALLWQAFTRQNRQAWFAAIAAGLVFSVLIFSYFFLWTAAIAWLACFVLVWLIARRDEWQMLVWRLVPTALFGTAALVVYAVLLSHRDHTMDTLVCLNFSHAPDFYRAPQFIAVPIFLLLFWGVRTGRILWREPVTLLTSSFALMPFVVFNQQIITGYSLQPIHYELFSANYLSLLALVLTLFIVWRGREPRFPHPLPKLLLAGFVCISLAWGVIEVHGATSVHRQRNIDRDSFVPVAKRLTDLAAKHGQGPNERGVVFSPNIYIISDNLSVFAPQAPLWASHLPFASGLSREELQERYFQYLYFCNMQPGTLASTLARNDFTMTVSLFGYDRYAPELTINVKPITADEIREKVREYSQYVTSFDRERARRPGLSFVVLHDGVRTDLTNLDHWYIRDAGERIGQFTLYQVKLRES